MNKAKEKYRGIFETQKSGNKTSSGEIGLDIRTNASPKVGQEQGSGGVSAPCRHVTSVADTFENLYSVMRSNSVEKQIREKEHVFLLCIVEGVSGLNKRTYENPKLDKTRCPEE